MMGFVGFKTRGVIKALAAMERWSRSASKKGMCTSTFCFTSTEARWLIRDGDGGWGGGGEEDERVKARPRIPPEKDRRDRGPPPEQWKC